MDAPKFLAVWNQERVAKAPPDRAINPSLVVGRFGVGLPSEILPDATDTSPERQVGGIDLKGIRAIFAEGINMRATITDPELHPQFIEQLQDLLIIGLQDVDPSIKG